jgi:hypothetical protein
MRVVLVNKYAHLTGGADQHCLGLAEALVRRGHEVMFMSTRDERNVVDNGVFVRCSVTHSSRENLPMSAQAAVLRDALRTSCTPSSRLRPLSWQHVRASRWSRRCTTSR